MIRPRQLVALGLLGAREIGELSLATALSVSFAYERNPWWKRLFSKTARREFDKDILEAFEHHKRLKEIKERGYGK